MYLMTDKSKEVVLAIVHSNYLQSNAGVEKVVLEQQKICSNLNLNFIVIFPDVKIKKFLNHDVYINLQKYNVVIDGKLKEKLNKKELKKFIQSLNIKFILIHHLNLYTKNNKLIKYIKTFSCPIYYYIHDYATICYNHTLLKNNKNYCGEDGIKFGKCFNCRFFLLGCKNHRFYKKLFNECNHIKLIFPSEISRDIWIGVFGNRYLNRCNIIPNQIFSEDLIQLEKDKKYNQINIAYIGYQNIVKGWNVFKKIVKLENKFLKFFVLGNCKEKLENVKVYPVSFIKDGENAMINAIKSNNINIAFLWSVRPETYAFTFYESYLSGAYIITNHKSGNISYMTKKLKCGKSFENELELSEFLNDSDNLKKTLEDYYKNFNKRPKELIANDYIFKLEKYENGDYNE